MSDVWVFYKANAKRKPELADHRAAYINPDRSLVRGIPPHFWKPPVDGKRVGGQFLPMSIREMAERDRYIKRHGADEDAVLLPALPQPPSIFERLKAFIKGALKRLLFWRR